MKAANHVAQSWSSRIPSCGNRKPIHETNIASSGRSSHHSFPFGNALFRCWIILNPRMEIKQMDGTALGQNTKPLSMNTSISSIRSSHDFGIVKKFIEEEIQKTFTKNFFVKAFGISSNHERVKFVALESKNGVH